MILQFIKTVSDRILPPPTLKQTIQKRQIREMEAMLTPAYQSLLSEEKRLIYVNQGDYVPADAEEAATWAKYNYTDFCDALAHWWGEKGFSIRAHYWRQMAARPKPKTKNQKPKTKKAKTDKSGFVDVDDPNFGLNFVNPKHMTAKEAKEVEAYLCDAELEAIAIHQPTLYEDKALEIKPFFLMGQSPEQASSSLERKHRRRSGKKKNGYGLSTIKYYFALYRQHSEQRPITEN